MNELVGWMLVFVFWAASLLVAVIALIVSAMVLGFVGFWIFMAAALGFKYAEHIMCRFGIDSPTTIGHRRQ